MSEDLTTYQWLQIFPEAIDIVTEKIIESQEEQKREALLKSKSYIKILLKKEIEQCKKDLADAEILKNTIDQRVIRICKSDNRWFWEMVRDIVYIEPLTEGREKKIKENIFKLSQLQGKRQEVKKDGKITDIDIAAAKQVPMSNFVKINERTNFASCPFHPDKTPSFKYYPKDNSWHCFSCGASKDAIDFVMKRDGISFLQAVKFLLNK